MPPIIIRLLTIAAISIVFANTAAAQCSCPKMSHERYGQEPVTVFRLSRNNTLAVCGAATQNEYSDFIVYKCGQPFAIATWDATQTCTITQHKDTLIVRELYPIANGPGMSLQWTAFYETAIFFVQPDSFTAPRARASSRFIRNLEKYTETEIKQVLSEYKSTHLPVSNYDTYLLTVHRLFWAYVSGSKQAGSYMNELNKKYGTFDGAVAEEFDDIIMTYRHYKTGKP